MTFSRSDGAKIVDSDPKVKFQAESEGTLRLCVYFFKVLRDLPSAMRLFFQGAQGPPFDYASIFSRCSGTVMILGDLNAVVATVSNDRPSAMRLFLWCSGTTAKAR